MFTDHTIHDHFTKRTTNISLTHFSISIELEFSMFLKVLTYSLQNLLRSQPNMTCEQFMAHSMKMTFPLRKFSSSFSLAVSIISFLMKGRARCRCSGEFLVGIFHFFCYFYFSKRPKVPKPQQQRNTIRIQNFPHFFFVLFSCNFSIVLGCSKVQARPLACNLQHRNARNARASNSSGRRNGKIMSFLWIL